MKKFFNYAHLLGLIIVLIVVFVFIWIYGTNLPFGYTDTAYHLTTAQGFVRAGGVTIWDFWESLPLGRPHNYPPLFHILLASILKTGIGPVAALKIIMEICITGGLAIYAWGISKLFNIKVAFWATFLLSLSVGFIRISATVIPATIALFLVPALFYFLVSRKWISYIIVFVFIFYLHLFLPYLIALAILVYLAIFERKLLLKATLMSLVAFALYLPWLIHILAGGWEYIKYLDSNYAVDKWREYPKINLIILPFFIVGTFYGIRKLNNSEKRNFYFFLILFASIFVLCFFSTTRTTNGHLLVPAGVISGIYLSSIKLSQKWKFYFFSSVVLYYLFYTPYLLQEFSGVRFRMNRSVVSESFVSWGALKMESREEEYGSIIAKLDAVARPGDTLVSMVNNFDGDQVTAKYQIHIANYFAGLASLSTTNLYDPEVYHRPAPDLTKTRFLLTQLPPPKLTSNYLAQYGYSDENLSTWIGQNFVVLSHITTRDEASYYLLKNKQTSLIMEETPPFVFPLWLADGVIIAMTGLVLFEAKGFGGFRKLTEAFHHDRS